MPTQLSTILYISEYREKSSVTATILPIKSEDLPIHQINAVGTASVSDSVLTTNFGIQFECIISDYIDIASYPLIVTENSMEISEETSEEIQKQEEQEESAASILTPATTPP
ncbi:hypothetical protein GLOIN_2v1786804 [Rhizophagus irregularis DAOM 181602=DAOM 197198]|nr:hypothetical protein GLOIN_2v1786804 [Rhizophagus irregularis DAOM 181602=DAOM 197198]